MVGNGLKSQTSQVQPYKIKIGEHKVILVDTPGFDDTNMSDTQVLGMIADWLQKTYEFNTPLSMKLDLYVTCQI